MRQAKECFKLGNQLILNIKNHNAATLANFHISENNATSFRALQSWQHTENGLLLYLYGTSGVGKTHLLHALCAGHQQSVLYLPSKKFQELSCSLLENIAELSLIALDDLESVVGNLLWEKAIFNLYNELQGKGGRLLIAASRPPQFLDFTLPDLKSRLSSGLLLPLYPLSDEDKIAALQKRAETVNVQLPLKTAQFLLQNCPRDLKYLFTLLEQLLNLALLKKRELTVPFVRKNLKFEVQKHG